MERSSQKLPIFGSLRGLCFAAILSAISIVLGKFLQIPNPFQEFIRISFENLPVIIAGITLGPIAGAIVGAVADLLGCVLYGYTVNPIITLGAAAVGAASGIMALFTKKAPIWLRVTASAVPAHLIGSVLIKSIGLAAWYLAKYELGLWEFILWRLLNYAIVGTLECVIMFILFKNRGFTEQVEKFKK